MQLEKTTDTVKRRFDDACGTAHGLELIGERWALLVLRELMLGSRRFSELRADLPGISANVLTQRLGELEARGLVRKVMLPPPANVQVYEATRWGLEAEPIIQALGRWAARSPHHDPTLPISAVSILLSFRTMLDRAAAKEMRAVLNFAFGDERYVARLEDGELAVERGNSAQADVSITAEPAALAAVVYGGAPEEMIGIAGNKVLARRFFSLFNLPPKAIED